MATQSWIAPIYFDVDEVECLASEEAIVPLTYKPAVILPAESQLNLHEIVEEKKQVSQSRKTKKITISSQPKKTIYQQIQPIVTPTTHMFIWLIGALGLLLTLMLLVDSYNFIVEQYTRSFVFGTVFLSLCLIIMTIVLLLSWRAYQNLRALRIVTALQQEGQQLVTMNGYGNAAAYLQKITHFYAERSDIKLKLEKFYLALNDSHQDTEMCRLFSSQVMDELDQEAYQIVVHRSKETAVMIMISPIALLDTALTLWRNIAMIRDIATLYGGRPGFLASMSLTGTVLQNLIYADVSSLLADSLAETLGGSVLSVFSAQAAQGLGSGVMTARVGLKAIEACRPLPFIEEEKPRLKDIRKEIVGSIKNVFENK